ncbi:MAG TPA: GAF domain-containing protein [Chitinophagaceae bacterium]|jgi:GAF domain-containing protein|nr:GAF domain-containing protein [Chitinophagaceae bacterium]HZJ61290.1 GAF domain-containing protein [Chitinophagaceae bacterium]
MEKLFDIILRSNQGREQKAKLIAEKIRNAKGYSWVGLYDVTGKDIHLISYAGRSEPAFTSFPNDKGLNGRANLEKRTVIVNDIDRDEDYILTFSDTQSEIVVPVFDTDDKTVKGTIDVESEQENAFDKEDAAFLEECAIAIQSLWNN